VVAPTGSALGSLPLLPMLAALPSGAHFAVPAWASVAVLSVPYLAGVFGGLLTVRTAPTPSFEVAPLWGFGCGLVTGGAMAVLAAFAGGPLGNGRLTAVGPSAWQAGLVTTLEVGVAAAVTAGLVNWLLMRREQVAADAVTGPPSWPGRPGDVVAEAGDDEGHRIYLDPWADDEEGPPDSSRPRPGPASLP
jgi:hypothetical protein